MKHKSGIVQQVMREKKIYCGESYLEVDIFSYTLHPRKKGSRSKKEKESLPAQKNLNDKNSKRLLRQLAETNFGEEDFHVSLTYNKDFLPGSLEEADQMVKNFLRRVRRCREKKGVEALKYILVTSCTETDGTPTRLHHHLLMNGGLSRDEVEDLWRMRRRAGEEKGRSIGYANVDRLQPSYNTGIEQMCNYISEQPAHKRRWSCSQNLERPTTRTNDYKYSRRQVQRIVSSIPNEEYWEKMYPGWTMADKVGGYRQVYNDFTGWSIYLKLRKKDSKSYPQGKKERSKSYPQMEERNELSRET